MRTIVAGASGALLFGAIALAPVPAFADPLRDCKTTKTEFPTDGFNTDVSVTLCVELTSPLQLKARRREASAVIRWSDGGAGKFEKFVLHIRLEQYDRDKAKAACRLGKLINGSSSNAWFTCPTAAYRSRHNLGWTADGYVRYNLNHDGEGDKIWSLRGTETIL